MLPAIKISIILKIHYSIPYQVFKIQHLFDIAHLLSEQSHIK